MFLSADEIRREVESGHIRIEPFLAGLLKPASYVLRLDDEFCQWVQGTDSIVPWSEHAGRDHLVSVSAAKNYLLGAGGFVLGATLERISISRDFVGILATLSHVARFGISAHLNSFWVSPGFGEKVATKLTLEISSHNRTPIELSPGMPICHLAFARTGARHGDRLPLEDSIYEGQPAPSGPKLYEEFATVLQELAAPGRTK